MARYHLLVLLVAYLPGLLVGDLTEKGPSISKASSFSSDLYTESPCELRPLSAWKDPQGNVWGVGDGNLWWFNATNLSWSLLPLPNGTAADAWRITCGDPRRYVALQGPAGTLVLHLPWQHWQPADADDVRGGAVDADASWCTGGVLFATDPGRGALYQLDHEEARWVALAAMAAPDDDGANGTDAAGGTARTWLGPDGRMLLAERRGSCRHLVATNASGAPWTVLAKAEGDAAWPDLDLPDGGLALTWRRGPGRLWLWQSRPPASEMWSFDTGAGLWERAGGAPTGRLPPLASVLAGWADEDAALFCVLGRSALCTALYSVSRTTCWGEGDVETRPPPATTAASRPNTTAASRVISPPSTAGPGGRPSAASASPTPTAARPRAAAPTPRRAPGSGGEDAVSILPARNTPWHQHSSVFGSVVFFGTSLTVFGLVGLCWCVRRCVHFPKEALLLRDPPSVRYTAIPDSLGRDARRPAAYAVIPDSVA